MKITKKIGQIVTTVLAVLMVVLAIVMMVGKAQNRVTFLFGYSTVWIETGSMENPASGDENIPARTYILVQKADASEIEKGDVIMFYSDDPILQGNLNTHRVTEVIGDHEEFKTKGDNPNNIEDKYTAKADKIVGVYVTKLAVLTAMMRFFLTPAGLVIFFLLFFLLMFVSIILPELIKNQRTKNESKKKEMDALIAAEVERLKRENHSKE